VQDVIPARIITTKYVIIRRYCRNCRKQVSGAVYNALPNERFGLRLMVLIVSLKLLGLSYQKISGLLKMLFGLDITESAINHAVKKISHAFGKRYEQMIEELKTEHNIHGDETSWRINGKNHWLWAFVGRQTVLYEIDKSRGRDAPTRILDGYDGNITSDSWPAWNYVGKTHQRCQWHYLNDLNDTIQYKNPGKEFASFAKRLQKILYDSQKTTAKKKEGMLLLKTNLERRIGRLIHKKYTNKHCMRFVKRLRREKEMLFTFLDIKSDYHNNAAERAIRPNVIIRKITNGHRSDDGAISHKILMSVKETCRLRGLNFYDYALEYLGNMASKS
ncbi:MAG: IS66 family transposase, partial [Nitrosopumilaceae archaeon]